MFSTLSIQRIMALSILALIVYVILDFGLYRPGSAIVAAHNDISESRRLLGRYEAIIRQAQDKAQVVESERAIERQLSAEIFRQANPALAGAALQSKLRSIAGASGVIISSSRTKGDSDFNGIGSITVEVTLRGSMSSIVDALHKIESSTPYLIVTAASLKQRSASRTKEVAPLDVRIEVVAFWTPRLEYSPE